MSSAVWLLSTRGRPKDCQAVLDACAATGMTSRGVVYVDETVDAYKGLRLPQNWVLHSEPEWGSLQASMQWVFNAFADAENYGWLADDTYPRTEGWDRVLEAAAGEFGFAHARDLWLSEQHRPVLERGGDMSSGLCWGGELVRTVGWWALPGVRQAGIDTAWCAIIEPLRLCTYVHDVVVEHKNYRTGKRQRDRVDSWTRAGVDYVQRDIDTRNAWVASPDFAATLGRVADATLRFSGEYRELFVADYMREHFDVSRMPAARRYTVQAEAERLWDERRRRAFESFGLDPNLGPPGFC